MGKAWSDDGHQVEAVGRVFPRVPAREHDVDAGLGQFLEHYRFGPDPLGEDEEKLVNQNRRGSVRVELAGSGYEHRPRHSSQETEDIGIDAPPLGPQLDGSQGDPESVDVRHEVEYLVRDAASVETPDALVVEVLEELIVPEVLLVRDFGESKASK